MIGIDTNVLVRLIVADDARQATAARNFIRDRCTSEDPGFVSNIVLAETAWTLAAGQLHSHCHLRPQSLKAQRLQAAAGYLSTL